MRRDRTKSILSIIATLVSVVLILVYWLAPADDASHPLYKLFFDCIPDSLVVLVTIPIVYWLLYTRGLTNMGDCPLFTGHSHAPLGGRRAHHHRHSSNPAPTQPVKTTADDDRDVLIVVTTPGDSAQNPNADNIITPLNATLRIAESGQMLVIFTRCYLPPEPPANRSRAPRPARARTRKADFLKKLYKPHDSVALDFCVQSQTPACSAVPNSALDMVISNPRAGTVYVAGVALESCVQAICQMALQNGKKTVALENAIAATESKPQQLDKMWQDLTAQGLLRQECLVEAHPESTA